jgi:hypothetical protein
MTRVQLLYFANILKRYGQLLKKREGKAHLVIKIWEPAARHVSSRSY